MRTPSLVVILILASRWTAFAGPIVYVTNSTSNFVTVVDIESGRVVRKIPVGVEPFGIAFSPDGSYAYVANAKSSTVSVIHTRRGLVTQEIRVSGKLPVWLAVSQDGSYIYVTNEGTHDVSVLAVASSAEVHRIKVGHGPAGIVVSPDGRFAYVANEGSQNVSLIDLQREVELRKIQVGSVPQGVAISAAGDRVYVANFGSDSVSIIDTTRNELISEISLRAGQTSTEALGPVGIAISADSKRIYTGNFKGGSVSVIDTLSRQVIRHIPVSPETLGVAVDLNKPGVYVASGLPGELCVIDPASLAITQKVQVEKGAFKLAVLPERRSDRLRPDLYAVLLLAGLLILLFQTARRASMSKKREVLLLGGIFLLALCLRVKGLDWGMPVYDAETVRILPGMRISYHMDEDNFLWNLTRVRPEGLDFYVSDFHWGTLQYYLVEAALLIAQGVGYISPPWREAFLSARPDEYARLFVVGRSVSVLLGSCSIFLVYGIAKKMFGSRAGLWAGLVLALLPLHVVNSHYLTSDITMVFFLLLSFLGLLVTFEKQQIQNYAGTGIAFGLAVAAKYNAMFFLPVVFASHFFPDKCPWRRKSWLYFGAVFGFLLGEPYVLLHGRDFWETLKKMYLTTAGLPEGAVPSWLQLAGLQLKNMAFFGLGVPFFCGLLLLVGGLAFQDWIRFRSSSLATRPRPGLRPSAESTLLWTLLVSFFASLLWVRQPMIRYTLPLVAFAVIPIARVLHTTAQLRWGRALACYLILSVFVFTYSQVAILSREHTVNRAFRWITQHLPSGASIAKGWPEIPVLNPEKYQVRNFYSGDRMVDFRNFFVAPNGQPYYPDYVLLDDLTNLNTQAEFRENLRANYDLVADFRSDPHFAGVMLPEWDAPHDWKYSHPRITIYKRKSVTDN